MESTSQAKASARTAHADQPPQPADSAVTRSGAGTSPDSDLVAQFRESRVGELGDLLNACLEEEKDPAVEATNLVNRSRELYQFHRTDMRSLVEHVIDKANGGAIYDWSANRYNSAPMGEQPWHKISDTLKSLLAEPPLYDRDWAHGPIEPQFTEAIAGWVDLAEYARHVRDTAALPERIDSTLLISGVMIAFRHRCLGYFTHLKTPGAERDRLFQIFDTILGRSDLDMDMFPAALTYFGSDGLQILNQLATEIDDLRTDLQQRAEQGLFDPEAQEPVRAEYRERFARRDEFLLKGDANRSAPQREHTVRDKLPGNDNGTIGASTARPGVPQPVPSRTAIQDPEFPARPVRTSPPHSRLTRPLVLVGIVGLIALIGFAYFALKPESGTQPGNQTELPFTGVDIAAGVAVTARGDVYVTEVSYGRQTGNDRVLMLSAGSSTQTELPFTGLSGPHGLAVSAGGDVFVVDTGNNRVLKLSAGSSTQTELPFTGLSNPHGVAVTADGDVIVADSGNDRVLKLSAESSTQIELPFMGLSNPQWVAVTVGGDVYVAEYGSGGRILKLSAGSSTPIGLTLAGLSSPAGVAVTDGGDVYVAEWNGDVKRVLKLSAGSSTPIEFPFTGDIVGGVAVTAGGDVYVSERGVLKLSVE